MPGINSNEAGKCLVLMVADKQYLLPTLVAAQQIQQNIRDRTTADICIYVTAAPSEQHASFSAYAESLGITVKFWNFMDNYKSNLDFSTYVSPSTLGRLLIASELPGEYTRILYVDGDVQLVGDITSMIDFAPTPGRLVAAVDSVAACINPQGDHGKEFSAYAGKLGINSIEEYFNAGILLCDLNTWKSIAQEALHYIATYPERCKFHDQSALNAVMQGKWDAMHPKYNYGPIYDEIGVKFSPQFFHFHGPHKPWARSHPFGDELAAPYDAIRARLPLVDPPSDNGAVRNLGNRRAPATLIRNALRRRRLGQYLSQTDFVLE